MAETTTITRHDQVETRGGEPVGQSHVLVTVFLRGAADGLTLVPPVGDDAYYAHRPTLAVSRSKAIGLTDYFGLHPVLEPLMEPFRAGEMGILHGVGSEDRTRSHFEAQDTMEHGGNLGSGWIARYLRARAAQPSALSAVAIGTKRPESLRGAPGGAVMQTIHDFAFDERDDAFVEQLAGLYARSGGRVGDAARSTIEAVRRLRKLRAEKVDEKRYPNTTFARGMREISKLIKADVGMAATTINVDGWDTHFVQDSGIGGRMAELTGGLDAFWRDLGDERSRVTVLVMTEFGRRVQENSSFGTDHGSGGVMFVLGAGVQAAGLGGVVKSGWKDLSESSLDEVGDVPAGINYRDVVASVLGKINASVEWGKVFPGHEVKAVG
jgi:uncharacterized protein (DUF1501 family)